MAVQKDDDNDGYTQVLLDTIPTKNDTTSSLQSATWAKLQLMISEKRNIQALDLAVFATYMCNMICLTAPIVLIPVISADPAFDFSDGTVDSSLTTSLFAAKVASIATLGGGAGKLINGFVCQSQGARRSLTIYMLGLSFCTALFATSHGFTQLALASTGIEFCSSIMWTASTVVFAAHYYGNTNDNNAQQLFTKSIGLLSLCSTAATLLTKIGVTLLLTVCHLNWRIVAGLASLVALSGAAVVDTFVTDAPDGNFRPRLNTAEISWSDELSQSVDAVVKNPMFWAVGTPHALDFLVRTCDKVLGGFFRDTTDLPVYLCGGLTSSLTIGFALGAVGNGNEFRALHGSPDKERSFLKSCYRNAVIAALVLAGCAAVPVSGTNGYCAAAVIASASGILAYSISLQFYSLPARFATGNFGENSAVGLSLMDGLGFLLCAPVWAATGRIVAAGRGGESTGMNALTTGVLGNNYNGWSLVWTGLAACVGVSAILMIGALPAVLSWDDDRNNERTTTKNISRTKHKN